MAVSNLKLLIDVSFGTGVESYLRNNGYDILSIREESPRATDEAILHLAVEQERLVVTMDKDFGELVYRSGKSHKGVLLLRLEDQNRQTKIDVLSRILDTYSAELIEHFSVYQNGQLRIKK